MRFLRLHGGGLDGLVLPVGERHAEPPVRIAVYSPGQHCWQVYGVGEARPMDVYKIRHDCVLPTEVPPGPHEVVELDYTGLMTPAQAAQVERITRAHLRSGDTDQRS